MALNTVPDIIKMLKNKPLKCHEASFKRLNLHSVSYLHECLS